MTRRVAEQCVEAVAGLTGRSSFEKEMRKTETEGCDPSVSASRRSQATGHRSSRMIYRTKRTNLTPTVRPERALTRASSRRPGDAGKLAALSEGARIVRDELSPASGIRLNALIVRPADVGWRR